MLSRHRGWCQKLMVVGEKDTLAKEEFKTTHADDSTKYRSVIVRADSEPVGRAKRWQDDLGVCLLHAGL